MKKTLLVIDIDHGNGWNSDIEKLNGDKKQIALAIKQTLEEWRASNGLIIFVVLAGDALPQQTSQVAIEHEGSGCIVCDSLNEYRLAEFLEHRHGVNYEPAFIKNSCNAFTNSGLISFLRSKCVTEVILAGCQTFACILETAQGAVRNGLGVTLLERCTHHPFCDNEGKQRWIQFVKAPEHVPVTIA